jgi:hypothetical protein
MCPYEDALIWEILGQCGLNLGDSPDQALDCLLVLDKVGLKGVIATASGGYAVVDEKEGHLDLLLGGRCLYLDVDLDIKTAVPLPPVGIDLSSDGSNIDGIVGI